MSRLKVTINRNIPLSTFTQVGKIVNLKVGRMFQYQNYQGRYILDSSDMIFERNGGNWDAMCDVHLFRPFQQVNESEPTS